MRPTTVLRYIFVVLFAFAALDAVAQTPVDPLAPPDGLNTETLAAYERGRLIFNAHWRPTGTTGPDDFEGLGPLYNRISCASCHSAGGRGQPPEGSDESFLTAIVRIGAPSGDSAMPHPDLGLQIQDRAVPDIAPEATISLIWFPVDGQYPDGAEYELRKPELSIDPAPEPPFAVSIRIAQPLKGVGHLARAVPAGAGHIGFGWKAAERTLAAQNAAALSEDMGITSLLKPVPVCDSSTAECGGGSDEVGGLRLAEVTLFTELLPPPAPTGPPDPGGAALFDEVGCSSCHIPELPVRDSPDLLRAYTDMSLHDMGPGLDDGLPEGDAKSAEWRTPPLWGLGTVLKDNPRAPLLHDGRARGPEEAILWHDGEARAARRAFMALSAEDRARLLAFLGTL